MNLSVYKNPITLTTEHLFYIIRMLTGIVFLEVTAIVRLRRKEDKRPGGSRRSFPLLDFLLRRNREDVDPSDAGMPALIFEVIGPLALRLRRVARARHRSPQSLAADLITHGLEREVLRARTERALGELTPREREVAWLAARGHTNRQIARSLVISEETVKTHVHNALAKFGLRKKSDLRLLLLDLGLRWWQDEGM
ncbi:MAG: helix-turn-helix transcriptional regulator [Anaerolineales bacterium]|jgi:RNA polymerase sigma factor (sigma-70 family)